METSDSDYFESADEDFSSDEDNLSVLDKPISLPDVQLVTTREKLENLKLDVDSVSGSQQAILDEHLDIIQQSIRSKSISNRNKKDTQITDVSDVKSEIIPLVKSLQSVQNENLDFKTEIISSEDGPNTNNNDITQKSELINAKYELVGAHSKDGCKQTEDHSGIQHEILEDVNSNSDNKIENINNSKTDNDEGIGYNKTFQQGCAFADSWNNDGWDIDDDNLGGSENLWNKDEICCEDKSEHRGEEKLNIEKQDTKVINTSKVKTENTSQIDKITECEQDVDGEDKSANDGWGGWGGWEVSSILSTATQSVSALTSQVSQGFSTALETGMGIPNPEELARLHMKEKQGDTNLEKEPISNSANSSTFGFRLSNLVSGVSNITKFVESTGNKVISGGLDTLETIGKKTMEVLQEGDPGLKKKRSFLQLEPTKPVLSQVLREAKIKAEQEEVKSIQEKHIPKKNYEKVFDDFHGLVHLEALEMLSKQCEIKLEMLQENCDADSLTEIQETLEQVRELCELPDEDDEEQLSVEDVQEKLKSAVQDLNVNITYDRLLSSWEEMECWLKLNVCDENEIHQQAIDTLAQLTAIAVEQYHKAGELLLIKDPRSTADEADSLVQLTVTLTSLIGIVAAKFSEKLNMKVSSLSNKEEVNSLITNVFFEAANSSSYIQDAFQLLIPVLQVGAV